MTHDLSVLPKHVRRGVEVTDGGCWTARRAHVDGYAATTFEGQRWLCHRLSYRLYIGEIPAGLVIDHTCHDPLVCAGGIDCPHRRCLNPAHLEAVSVRENTVRGATATRPTCIHGHAWTAENTMYVSSYTGHKHRRCKACVKARRARKDSQS